MTENNNSTMSFDRMRNMLTRAAEIRESEQQQIFDALDEIHARMSPLESLGSVRKRLSELPDRTEVSVLAERLDEALAKLEAQDNAVADIGRAVDALVDKLAKPFAQLDGRLDGVAGRFEGVAGRMDGLEDKLASIHKRIDDLDGHLDKQDGKVDAIPGAVTNPLRERIEALEAALRGRLDEVDEGVHEHLDGTREALQKILADSFSGIHGRADEQRDALAAARADLAAAVADSRAELVSAVTDRHNQLATALAETRSELSGAVADSRTALTGTVTESRDALASTLAETRAELASAVTDTREAVNGKLDEARTALYAAIEQSRDQVDAADRLEALAGRLEQVTSKLDTMTDRLDKVEDDFATRIAELGGSVDASLSKVAETVGARPDTDALQSLVRKSNQESELRIGGQLDEAMATFAELILGGGSPTPPPPPTALPRPQRRTRKNGPKPANGGKDMDDDDLAAEGASPPTQPHDQRPRSSAPGPFRCRHQAHCVGTEAWEHVNDDQLWAAFEEKFRFRPIFEATGWPLWPVTPFPDGDYIWGTDLIHYLVPKLRLPVKRAALNLPKAAHVTMARALTHPWLCSPKSGGVQKETVRATASRRQPLRAAG